ncbi:hypothetical protein AB0K52_17880 [Glycomyces sp. NPDC049804]|uniref:hypothetical protein n=1 Tax=Glycomyces sp. NPDC049804 TaxID=3154363 RepID=UPI003445CC09
MNQARMRVLLQQAFYRHDHLGPGAPLREITGQGDGDGYYDWAGRRLFLADGEPDPMCPGAYRYQHNPASCDEEAPDSDPRSPRYEPMHLRHRPGDTWIIDTNRPYDPFDPGPYGSPGWYKDERTGRHRRDETPDPLPAEDWDAPVNAWFPGTADWPEPEPEPTPARARSDRRGDHDRGKHDGTAGRGGSDHRGEHQGRGGSSGRGGADRPPPWGPRGGRPVPSEPDDPQGHGGTGHRDEPQGHGGSDHRGGTSGRGSSDLPPPWGLRGRPVPAEPDEPDAPLRPWDKLTGHPVGTEPHEPEATDKPEAREEEPRRPRFWTDSENPRGRGGCRASGDRGWISGACDTPTDHDTEPDDPPPHRFSKLREDAFDRFIANSAQLRAAHFAPQKPYLRERAAWVLHWLAWVLTCGLIAMPAPLNQQQHHHTSPAAHPIPTQPVPATRENQARQADQAWSENDFQHAASPAAGPSGPQPVEANTSPRPGAAIAAAISGARAARRVIAARENRTEHDLARAVRNSATRRPSPRPYMATWEHAFDTNATFIIGGGIA